MNVQSCINHISFPSTIKELDRILNNNLNESDLERILHDESYDRKIKWSMPNWIQKNDITFFYNTKTADKKIKSLIKNLDSSDKNYKKYDVALKRSLKLHEKYGGKIFAIGLLGGEPEHLDFDKDAHFKGDIFGEIDKVFLLENPIDIDKFSDFISICRGTFTHVFGEKFEQLKKIIMKDNKVPDWFEKSIGTKFELKNINKKNFLEVLSGRLERFILEEQFRSFYVNYLLKNLSDGEVYIECFCYKKGHSTGRVDNIIFLNGKNIFVEVKLNINSEADLPSQLQKYVNPDYFKPANNKGEKIDKNIFTNKIIVIDTIGIYLYGGKNSDERELIEKIDNLKNIDSIYALKNKLIKKIFQK